MRDFWRDATAAWKGRAGANQAGIYQTKFENIFDSIHDDILGPALRSGAALAFTGGSTILGGWLGGQLTGGSAVGIGIGGLLGMSTSVSMMGIARAFQMGGMKQGMATAAGHPGKSMLGGLARAMPVNPIDLMVAGPMGILKGIGGAAGVGGAAMMGARSLIGLGMAAGRGLELGARTLLTGSPVDMIAGRGLVQGPLDSWFPFFRNTPNATGVHDHSDILQYRKFRARGHTSAKAAEMAEVKAGKITDPRKFAPNPRIIRRAVAASALFSLGSAVHEAMSPQIAPPTAYFDGRYMRHINDLGAGGSYGMGVLGRNSSLNMNMQDASRIIAQVF